MADGSDPDFFTKLFAITSTTHRDVYNAVSPSNPANAQDGKIILITGGGTGIGAGIAQVWTKAGAEGVIITGRRKEKLDGVKQQLEDLAKKEGKKTKILAVQNDVTKNAEVEQLFAEVKSTFGRPPDVVIHNAGWGLDTTYLADIDAETWDSIIVSSPGLSYFQIMLLTVSGRQSKRATLHQSSLHSLPI